MRKWAWHNLSARTALKSHLELPISGPIFLIRNLPTTQHLTPNMVVQAITHPAHNQVALVSIVGLDIVTCGGVCDCRRGLIRWMDLLSTHTHDSEVQVLTTLSLIYTIYKSDLNNGDSSLLWSRRCLLTYTPQLNRQLNSLSWVLCYDRRSAGQSVLV
jgi:hypothetical protein